MLTIERIGEIAQKQTEGAPAQIRQIAADVLSGWANGHIQRAELCSIIDARIAQLPQSLKNRAESIRKKIRSSLSDAAVDSAQIHAGHRRTAKEIFQELNIGFTHVEAKGRGIVFFGSARTEAGSPFYEQARELGREVYRLLKSTSWSGAGPGQMQAALEGAKELGGNIAGVKIHLDRHQAAIEQDVSPVFNSVDEVVTCDHFDPRVTSLTDAGWPEKDLGEKGAFIFFPGAIGTLHELFVISVIKQLYKSSDGKDPHVPIIIMNYEDFYRHQLMQLQTCIDYKMVRKEELERIFRVCPDNRSALDVLADHYRVPSEKRDYTHRTLLPTGTLDDGAGI